MLFNSFAQRRSDGRHYSGPAKSGSQTVAKRISAGILGLALLASIGAGAVVSDPAQANTPDATASATPGVAQTVESNEAPVMATTTEAAVESPLTATATVTPEEEIPQADDSEAAAAASAEAIVVETPKTPVRAAKEAPLAQLLAAPAVRLSCASGIVYTTDTSGVIRRVNTATGAQTTVDTIQASGQLLNGLALTKNANFAYAVGTQAIRGNRDPENVGDVTVYQYESSTGNTTALNGAQNVAITFQNFVMGGINPKTDIYYYGRVVGATLELYAFNTQSGTNIGKVGSFNVPADSRGTNRVNGDLVFSSEGIMYFVASAESTATDSNILMRVNQTLPTTAGNTALTASKITNLNINNQAKQFNGIAFDGGHLFLDTSAGELFKVDPSSGNVVTSRSNVLSAPVDMASCQYNNTLLVQKNIVDRVVSADQFIMKAAVGGTLIGTDGTTTGSTAGLQTADGTFGSSVPISGSVITISETGTVGTNLSNYSSTWSCTDQGGAAVGSGTGTSGSFTFPPQETSGVNVKCIFTNSPKSSQVTVTKTWVNAVTGDTAGFTANTATGTSVASTSGNVITANFYQGTMVNVAEVLGAANKGIYATTLKCTNAEGAPVTQGTLTGSFRLGASNVTCAYVNTNTPASIVVDKKWIVDGVAYDNGKQPSGISAALTLTGPGAAGATAQGWATARTGYFAGDNVSIAETMSIDPQMRCTLTKSALTLANGTTVSNTLPSNVVLAAGSNSYLVTNTVDCRTELTLLKFIDGSNGTKLSPSDFTLTATPSSGTALQVPGANTVTAANTKVVPAGTAYTLSESSPTQFAYQQLSLQRYTGVVNANGTLADPTAWVDAAATNVSVPRGHHEIYRFVNASVPAFTLPLTGGSGSSPYLLVGGGLLVLAVLAAAWVIARRVRSNRS
ncbi:LPXTG cell wall anchor domain-containing protein [Arthrobacter psychrolactophilus]|nr:LPXTG cell wall anchor domain-containing protein [Arthrobacter psychrolactophilus]